jgi:hypothetical protein
MKLPTATALFCEDIRQEKNGQHSLVGILPDNITVEGLPGLAPKLGVYIRTNLDPNADLVPVSYRLVLPDGSVPVTDEVKQEVLEKAKADAIRDDSPFAGLVSRVVISPFPLEHTGRIRLLVRVGEDEILAGSINVRLATSSSEKPQPSAQSPDASQPKDS